LDYVASPLRSKYQYRVPLVLKHLLYSDLRFGVPTGRKQNARGFVGSHRRNGCANVVGNIWSGWWKLLALDP